jgi:hypothetical protein
VKGMIVSALYSLYSLYSYSLYYTR